MYDRACPPLWIITVLLPGFNVLPVQGPCAIAAVASAAWPPVSGNPPASWLPPLLGNVASAFIDPLVPEASVSTAPLVVPLPPTGMLLTPEPVGPRPLELAPLCCTVPPLLVPDWFVAVPAPHAAATNASSGHRAAL
jgi:hypothetical protein